jgi:8-oxo-dGTP diphosphatase
MAGSRAEQQFLRRYDRREFLAPLTTVDMAIFSIIDGQLKVLLVERSNFPAKGELALPGGFVDEVRDADLLETAHRKLTEKTGIESPYLEQVATIGTSTRDPRGWSVTILHFALIDSSAVVSTAASVAEVSKWVSVEEASNFNLAFDHTDLLAMAIDRLRSKTRYTALPLALMSETFTLTELQTVFEVILEVMLEKKSFRRRLLDSGLIEETGIFQHGTHRPAALFRRGAGSANSEFPRSLEIHGS